jgi:predicted methyltransferase
VSYAAGIGTLVVMAACSSGPTAPAATPTVASAIADPARHGDVAADARRHPAELITFAGVKPGDTVVDLIPGNGYFTRIFSLLVGPTGHVYAVWPNEYAKEDGTDVAKVQTLAADPHFANVTMLIQPASAFAIPGKTDVVWTSQNYHDYPDKFMGPTDLKLLDDAVFASLNPGGVFVVIDHAADPGSGLRDTETLHRIDPAIVKTQVAASGFVLDGESDVLRNAADTHQVAVFDPSVRGRTDQFVLRFRKPK